MVKVVRLLRRTGYIQKGRDINNECYTKENKRDGGRIVVHQEGSGDNKGERLRSGLISGTRGKTYM